MRASSLPPSALPVSVRDPVSSISGRVVDLWSADARHPTPDFVGRLLKADALTLVALQDTEEHLQRRRSWIRGFSPGALKDYEHRIAYRVGLLRDGLAKEEGVVLLDQWFNYFS